MRIKCQHGYFKFFEDAPGEISRFASIYGFELEPKDDYYTFSFLLDAPEYSFIGKPYLGLPAIKKFAGHPWEVMRENNFIYDFTLDMMRLIQTVILKSDLKEAGNYFVSSGLLMPGSFRDDGKRVKEYTAWMIWSTSKFKYSEVVFES